MRKLFSAPLALALALGACNENPSAVSADAPLFARVAGADQGGRALRATLAGSQEVPAANTPATGSIVVTLNPGQGEICYDMSAMNLLGTPVPVAGTAAHIHEAPAGRNGPVVVGLPIPLDKNFTTQNCVSASRALIQEILQDPSNYYVNLNTDMFRPGEVRGQLSK
jgi:hypothetical protein